MRRRDALGIVGGAVAWPLAARAQHPDGPRRIGLLPTGYRESDPEGRARVDAFVATLGKLGWNDGRNIQLDIRWPNNDIDQIRTETIALAASAPAVFVVSSNAALAALKKLDKAIPTVFVQVSDPVGSGFVGSLAHPDGNVTGFQNFEPAVAGKWLGLLKEVAPGLAPDGDHGLRRHCGPFAIPGRGPGRRSASRSLPSTSARRTTSNAASPHLPPRRMAASPSCRIPAASTGAAR